MNRSVLIIICDFLLVSLLAFSTVDLNRVMEEGQIPEAKTILATNAVETGKDLAAVMKLALEEEQRSRDLLMGELASSRTATSERDKQLREVEQNLKAQAQNFQQSLAARAEEAENLKAQQAELQKQYASAQSNVQNLNQQLQNTSADASLSRERLAQLEAELKKRAQEAAAYQKQLDELSRTNQVVLTEKQRLANQLQLAELEKRNAAQRVNQMQEQVEIERAEKARLAEGVKSLAARSDELKEEIRSNRALASNTIFSDYLSNRVEASVSAFRPGVFVDETVRRKEASTVLVSQGTNTYAVTHVADTPLALAPLAVDWQRMTGTLTRRNGSAPIRSLSFHRQDPRVIFMPVNPLEARQLGVKTYEISDAPFKFEDVVLVGASQDYYGECRFEIDTETREYLKLDRSMVKGLFGKFNPSRGDLVFTRNGDLLGIMANDTYCLMLKNFPAAATVPFATDLTNYRIGRTLSQLNSFVLRMPSRLQ